MSLILRDPFRELDQFHDRLSEIFSKGGLSDQSDAILPVNVYEENGQLKIDAVVPNFEPKEVEVNVTKDNVEIKAEHTSQSTDEGRKYYHKEATYKTMYRRIAIPNTADVDKAKAVHKNGVVSISIPIAEIKESKKLEIESAD